MAFPAAADIDEAIELCSDAVNDIGNSGGSVLATVFSSWLSGLFDKNTGIFKNLSSANERTVIDWHNPNQVTLLGLDQTATTSPTIDIVNTVDAVFRVLNAVKFATIRGDVTTTQESDTVSLFNSTWC